jgi:hypothetical protein
LFERGADLGDIAGALHVDVIRADPPRGWVELEEARRRTPRARARGSLARGWQKSKSGPHLFRTETRVTHFIVWRLHDVVEVPPILTPKPIQNKRRNNGALRGVVRG